MNNNNNNKSSSSSGNNSGVGEKKKKKKKVKKSKNKKSVDLTLDKPDLSQVSLDLSWKNKNNSTNGAKSSRVNRKRSKTPSSSTSSSSIRKRPQSARKKKSRDNIEMKLFTNGGDNESSRIITNPDSTSSQRKSSLSINMWRSAVNQLHHGELSLSPIAHKNKKNVAHLRDIKARMAINDTQTYKNLRKELNYLEKSKDHIPEDELDDYHTLIDILSERVKQLQNHIALNQHALRDVRDTAAKASNKKSSDQNINALHDHLTHAVEVAEEAMANFGHAKHKVERLETFQPDGGESVLFRHKHIVGRPRLRQYWKNNGQVLVREDREHKVSWNELFFDLVFVVGLAHIGHDLIHNRNTRGLFEFIVLFAMLWRNWTALNVYINRFDPQDALHKVYYFIQMVSVMGMVSHVTRGVVYSYLLGRGSTEIMNIWAALFEPRVRRAVAADLLVYLFASLPLIYSIVYIDEKDSTKNLHPENEQLYWWGSALIIEFVGQLILDFVKDIRIPVNIEHVTERFGLFTIIMLGEQVASALFQSCEATFETYMSAVFAGIITLTFQIFYFDVECGPQRQHALLRHGWRPHIWFMLHLPLQAAIICCAVGMHLLIVDTYKHDTLSGGCIASSDPSHKHGVIPIDRWLFCGGEAVVFLSFVVLGYSHHGLSTLISKKWRMLLRTLSGITMGLLPIAGKHLHPEVLLGIGAALGVIVGAVEMYGGVVPKDTTHNSKRIAHVRSSEDTREVFKL